LNDARDDDETRPTAPESRLGTWIDDRLGRLATEERGRLLLWIPVLFGVGVALYFAVRVEPPLWAGPAALVGAGLLAVLGRRRTPVLVSMIAVATIAAGFAAGQTRTWNVDAPKLARPITGAVVTGRVETIERMATGTRVTLVDTVLDKPPPGGNPKRVRLRLVAKFPPPPSGATVRFRAALLPPASPAEPGAYDFRLAAYFSGIGAVGFAFAPAEVIDPAPPGLAATVGARLDSARGDIARRVRAVVDDRAGPVTIALLNGEQTGISEPVMAAMRASGLAHLLSISGLHVAIVAGLVYAAARALGASIEVVALRFPIKKIAAVLGIAAAGAYAGLVGTPVPTARSLLVTGLGMLAVTLDRRPFSPRVLGVAALVVTAAQPESLIGPSYQMSFGAVLALIAAFEVAEPRLARLRRDRGFIGRFFLNAASLAGTSLVASLATAPFSLFHFQNATFYGVVANMIAVPLTSLWVMPAGLVAYLLMPLGWEGPALIAMNWGSMAVVWIAETVASWPGAVAIVPAMPGWGLPFVALGGCWLCLWRTPRRRLWGVPVILIGMLSPFAAERPDILVDDDGGLAAVRGADGRLIPSKKRGDRIAAETWARRDGDERFEDAWPNWGVGAGGLLNCDPLGCVWSRDGRKIALARRPEGAIEDCGSVDAVIAPFPVKCRATPIVIDKWKLARDGAHALTVRVDEIRVTTARDRSGDRPWTR